MMKKVAKPKPIKRRTANLAVALATLASCLCAPVPAFAEDPTTATQTAGQQFVIALTDHLGQATTQQQFVLTLTDQLGTAVAQQQFLINLVQPGTETDTQQFVIALVEPEAITLSVTPNQINLSGTPGTLLADYLTANVITSNTNGYRLDIEATEPRLKCATSNDYIEPLTTPGPITDNHWAWARDDNASPTSTPASLTWTGVAVSPTEIKTYNTATDPTNGDNTRIWFGTQAAWTLPACSYSGMVTVTVVGN
jgi:hypothetical protein